MDLNYSSLLFCPNDSPLTFYIPPSSLKSELKLYIEKGGGNVTNLDSYNNIRLLLPGLKCMSKNMTACEYVYDCVLQNKLLDINLYVVTQGRTFNEMNSKPSNHFNKIGRQPFTPRDDDNIIHFLADNEECERPRGNEIWKKAEKLKITCHSWQSMRDRFLKRILKRLKTYSHIDHSVINKLVKMTNKIKKEVTSIEKLFPKQETFESSFSPHKSSDQRPNMKRGHDFLGNITEKKIPRIPSSSSSLSSFSPHKSSNRKLIMNRRHDNIIEKKISRIASSSLTSNRHTLNKDTNREISDKENEKEINHNITDHQNEKHFVQANHKNDDASNQVPCSSSKPSQHLRDMITLKLLEQTGSQVTTSSFNSLFEDMQPRGYKNRELLEKYKASLLNRPVPTTMKCVAVRNESNQNDKRTLPSLSPDLELSRKRVPEQPQEEPTVYPDLFDEQHLSEEFFADREKIKLALEWLNIPEWVLDGASHLNNGDLDDAIYWLLHCKTKSGIPIYTKHDDELLLSGSKGFIESLEVKYGKDGVKKRLDFLSRLMEHRDVARGRWFAVFRGAKMDVFCTCGRGTEIFVALEIFKLFENYLKQINITDGKVFSEFNEIPIDLKNIFRLKICERVFIKIFHSTEIPIYNNKQGMAIIRSKLDKISSQKWVESVKMLEHLKQNEHENGDDDDDDGSKIKRKCQRLLTFRVSAKCSGRPAKHVDNKWLSYTVSQKLTAATSLKVDLKSPDLEIFFHLNNGGLVIGIPFCSHPLSKRSYLKHNGLRSTVASIVSSICPVKPGMTLLDPMCGKGILLLEAASQYKHVTMIGCDIDNTSLRLANENVSHFNAMKCDGIIQLMKSDAKSIPLISSSIDVVLCDIPFGNKHNLMEDMEAFLKSINRLLVKGGRCIILGGFLTTKDLMSKVKKLFACNNVASDEEEDEKEEVERLPKLIRRINRCRELDDRLDIDHVKNVITSSMDVNSYTDGFLKNLYDGCGLYGGCGGAGGDEDCKVDDNLNASENILTPAGDNEDDDSGSNGDRKVGWLHLQDGDDCDVPRSKWKQELIHYLKLGETDSFVTCFRKIC